MEPPKKKEVQIIQELPCDIWNQIFLRIPAETVIKLKSVCKSWHELINSKKFQISHVDHWRIRVSADTTTSHELITLWPHTPEILSLESVSDDDEIPSKVRCRTLEFDQLLRRSQRRLSGRPTEIDVLYCYDGLFLVCLMSKRKHMFLCNPLTKSYLALPFPKGEGKIAHLWAFVYDPSTRGYVIFFSNWCFTVYSLRIELNDGGGWKIGAWREVWSIWEQRPFPGTRVLSFLASISINGKAHWLFNFIYNNNYADQKTGILTIDASSQESIFTKCSDTPTSAKFFNSNSKFYCLKKSSSREAFELWAVNDLDNPTWLKHHVISKTDKVNLERMISSNYAILIEGSRLIIHHMYTTENLYFYDLILRKWHTVGRDHPMRKLMSIHYSLLSWN